MTITVPTQASVVIPGCAFLIREFLDEETRTRLGVSVVEETRPKWVVQMTYAYGWPARRDPGHSMARFGDEGLTYTYKGKPKPMYGFTPALDEVRSLVTQSLGWTPNCVVVNSYAPASGLYPHRDGNYIPELGDTPTIVSVSFGATRTFLLHPANPDTNKRVKDAAPVSVQLGPGDLFVMHGECDRKFHHSIPTEPEANGDRVSLTFRQHLKL